MITYRQAVPEDGEQVMALLREIMEHHGVAVPEEGRIESVVRSAFASPYHCFVVADEAGAIVGMCALVFTYSTWSTAMVCELQDVVVREDRRRKRIGHGLLRSAEQVARDRGCARMFLLAEAWNFGAHAFYRDLGLSEKTCLYFERNLGEP
jgi:GNAT superfamily N-acetyltransferase